MKGLDSFLDRDRDRDRALFDLPLLPPATADSP